MTASAVPPAAHGRTGSSAAWRIDGGALVLLGALALLGLRTSYEGWTYLLVGLLGLVLGVLLGQLAHLLRQPVITLAVLTVAAFFLLGGAVALHPRGLSASLPLPATLATLAHQGIYGWKELLTTLPPVAGDGPLLVLPYLLGLVAGAGGMALATRLRSPMLPVLAPVLLLAAVILLGVQHPTDLLVQGGLVAAVALGWVALRAARLRPPLQSGTGGTARAASGLLLVTLAAGLGVLAGPSMPGAASHDRLVLRNYVTPPFDIGQYASPLASFRRYTKPQTGRRLYDTPLYTVKAEGLPAGALLRLATLDRYDGTVWGASNRPGLPGEPVAAFQRVGTRIDNHAPGTPVHVTITVRDGGERVWLPTIGTLRSIEFHGVNGDRHAESFRYNVVTGTGVAPDGLAPGDSYSFDASVADLTLRPRDTASGLGQVAVADSPCPNVVQGWLEDAALEPALAQVRAVAARLRHGAYSDGGRGQERYLPGHSVGRLHGFACAGKQMVGNDEQYAAMMALAANQLEVPARVVLGAAVGADGTVRGRDIHAWVELRTGDGSWRVLPTKEFLGREDPDNQPPSQPEPITGKVLPPPAPVHPPASAGDVSSDELNRKSRSKTSDSPFHLPYLVWLAIRFVVGPLLALALVVGTITALKGRRRRRRRTRGSPATRLAGGWGELLDHARELGRPLPAGRTRREQAAVLDVDGVHQLAAEADAGIFGPGDHPEPRVHRFWEEIDAMRGRMSRAAGWRRRWLAAVNVSTLVRRPVRSGGGAR